MKESDRYEISQYKGRNRRLLYEWQQLEQRLEHRHDITCQPVRRNKDGLPTAYLVLYQLRSICGVGNMEHFGEPGVENPPVFATGFQMRIDLPDGYPSVDSAPVFRFLTYDEQGQPIPHPWHPNIRFFGDFAGRVCINMPAIYAMRFIMPYPNHRTPRTSRSLPGSSVRENRRGGYPPPNPLPKGVGTG